MEQFPAAHIYAIIFRKIERNIADGSEIGDKGGQLHYEPFAGFERLTVCDYDRTGFLSDIISCFTAEGYDILSARIYSTVDRKVLDIFNLEPPDKPRLSAQKHQ